MGPASQVGRRSALITGGTGSIGRAMVMVFARYFDVTFTYCHREELAASLAEEAKAKAIRIDFLEADIPLRDVNYDVLVNNAAINISRVHVAQRNICL
jgi:NAD(P)-dependent dehydrogenase (short-subunit alcohol dehydrogenase family)